jgi:phage/plasmid primase-like uncharacterized protein
MRNAWTRVTRAHPCPICKKPDWCTIGERGVCCMRVESHRPMKNGGWFHVDESKAPVRIMRRSESAPRFSNPARLLASWSRFTQSGQVQAFALALGVSTAALTALGAAWCRARDAWAFPMRDAAGKIVGIRVRTPGGAKKAVIGSAQGLFYPADFAPAGDVFIVEGPTDAAAVISLGFDAVGRPSCSGGVEIVQSLLDRIRPARAIIIADDDTPGRRGAIHLADLIQTPAITLALPAKDFREFVRAGATAALVRQMIQQQETP